ncbi:MAG: 30S ribosomal protein S18 [Candidatus Omnitrophica bacterium]|nr:30S ribosomal protein S18 [Candidatus Omnitrophota bacterium]MBU1932979.1 30S ribosomal protein S18 [Candidatus Omnitrophota bacterium]
MIRKERSDRFKKKDLKKKKRGPKDKFFRKKFCKFCADKVDTADYKDTAKLRKFITEQGKILPNRITGNCASHQRVVTAAIKRARHMALLPFVGE